MILYLGTSSLVKLYVKEPYSEAVRKWFGKAEIIATCRVAYTETVSALDIRFNHGDIALGDYDRLLKVFSDDWTNYAVIDFDEIEAGNLAKKYGIRRFDAMHLSAAKLLQDEADSLSIKFSSFDIKLCDAATAEGLHVLRPSTMVDSSRESTKVRNRGQKPKGRT